MRISISDEAKEYMDDNGQRNLLVASQTYSS